MALTASSETSRHFLSKLTTVDRPKEAARARSRPRSRRHHMTSFEQFEANRRNALRSTRPKTDDGKRRSQVNDYCAETALARELVLRLASLLWRLRRATVIETDLFEIQAEALRERRLRASPNRTQASNDAVYCAFETCLARSNTNHEVSWKQSDSCKKMTEQQQADRRPSDYDNRIRQLSYCFLRLANLDSGVFERLNRYEAALWRQTVQTLFALNPLRQR
jgi:hypothetical protein